MDLFKVVKSQKPYVLRKLILVIISSEYSQKNHGQNGICENINVASKVLGKESDLKDELR